MTRSFMTFAAAAVSLFASLGAARATVIPLAHWRGGEIDPGAVAGATANSVTQDLTDNDNDASSGSPPLYSSSTPFGPSALSYDFDGENYSRPILTTAVNNVGMESWFFFDTVPTANTVVLYNGNAGSSGFGLLVRNSQWSTLIGGETFGDTGVAVPAGEWIHVAAVRDNGTLQLYVNGSPAGSTTNVMPNTPTGSTSFGRLDGRMDEVRVFEFAAGQFDPSTDLLFTAENLLSLLPVPEPASHVLLVPSLIVVTRLRRRRVRLHETQGG